MHFKAQKRGWVVNFENCENIGFGKNKLVSLYIVGFQWSSAYKSGYLAGILYPSFKPIACSVQEILRIYQSYHFHCN